MKQTFTETKEASWRHRLVYLQRRGWPALAMGLAIVALLITGNLLTWIADDTLMRIDEQAYRQPPQWPFFQRLLYHPPTPVEPYTGGTSDLDALLGPLNDTAADQAATAPTHVIASRPSYTAVAGRAYHYQVRVDGPPDALAYTLLAAPPGMSVDEVGLIQWTPTAEHAATRSHDVEVAVAGPDGRGTRQAYTIIVSAYRHLFGTDQYGRDLGALLLLGTRWTVFPGLLAVSVSLLLGLLFGGLAGYYEGRTNTALSYLAYLSEAFPALVLLFLAAVIFRYQLYPIMGVLGIILFPGVARRVKARVLTLKARQFVEASKELGLRDAHILWIDIIWYNTRSVLLTQIFYGFALAIVVEVTLSYLNLSNLPPTVSWGNMIQEGRDTILNGQYWTAFFPAVATVLAVAGYHLLGSGLGQRFRLRKT